MTLGAEYYDKELLIDCIRFNAQFLELSVECSNPSSEVIEQCNELRQMLDIWKSKQFGTEVEVEYAIEVIQKFTQKHDVLEFLSNFHLS